MESESSRVKRARLLSRNQIREIVINSDSDEEKYYVSEDTEDDERSPPSRRSSVSDPPSPDFSASSSEDEDIGNVAGQQAQPCLWRLPPQSQRRVVHTFTGAPNGKSEEVAHVTSESTPLSVLLLFFAEIVTLLVVETNRYYHQFLENFDDGHSPEREVTEAEMFAFFGSDITYGTYSSRHTGGLLDGNGTYSHFIL